MEPEEKQIEMTPTTLLNAVISSAVASKALDTLELYLRREGCTLGIGPDNTLTFLPVRSLVGEIAELKQTNEELHGIIRKYRQQVEVADAANQA
jgi:hypothetical protein